MTTKTYLIDTSPRPAATMVQPTDWTLCVLCQDASTSPLVDPSRNSNKACSNQGYKTLAKNLTSFHQLGVVPMGINISRLDDGSGIEQTLINNKAKWHKTCYNSCNEGKVSRAQKRAASEHFADFQSSPIKSKLRSFTNPGMVDLDQEDTNICFFCGRWIDKQDLHKAATKDLDAKVRKIATELRDTTLIAKLSNGDLTALDAVYHKKRLTALHTRYRSFCRKKDTCECALGAESIAFAELISYIEEVHNMETDSNYIMKLTDLVTLFTNRLQQLQGNTPTSSRVNSTRFKEKLLESIPELQANKSTHGIVFSFKDRIGDALLSASQRDSDSDAVVLMRAAQIIRREMFQKKHSFNGSFRDDNLDSIPATLLALIQMILGGTSIKTQTENNEDVSSAVLSLAQLMIFNSVKRARKGSHSMRHSPDRETLLPLYIGILVHSKTRKRDLVDILYSKGMSVSYDRVL